MERKIGEVFKCDGKTVKIVEGVVCTDCDLYDNGKFCNKEQIGFCSEVYRKDKKTVICKEVKIMKDNEKKGTVAEMYACANDELKKVLESKFSKEELGIKKELPDSWEEFVEQNEIKNTESYITDLSDICNVDKDRVRFPSEDRNILPNKETAEAFLALMQLIQLRDCYRNGWEPNWDDDFCKYTIVNMKGKIDMKEPISHSSILSFPNPELRNTFFSNFKDLIETAKELI